MKELAIIGWREWVALPELGISHLKAKVDTGARTSSLHAYYVEPYEQDGIQMVRFGIHPIQRDDSLVMECCAPLKDTRMVTDSGGHREERYVIETLVRLGDLEWRIEMTLANRDTMLFRMLLGRRAIRRRLLVNPGRSFLKGKKPEDPRFFLCKEDDDA